MTMAAATNVPATNGQQATTVGAYLRDLPPDRRVAMARVCSMIRRSARGVRESMRYGLAFYELDGPLFALESGRRHMSLYVAEQDVVVRHKDALPGVNAARSYIKFSDLNRLPLDIVEKIVRDSVAARRTRVAAGTVPTQADLLKLWAIKEEAAAPPAVVAKALAPAAAAAPAESAAKTSATRSATKPAGASRAATSATATTAAAKPAHAKVAAKTAAPRSSAAKSAVAKSAARK
jgi:uncharacterized protein YdhG (YjbR/CyaY superfamily)